MLELLEAFCVTFILLASSFSSSYSKGNDIDTLPGGGCPLCGSGRGGQSLGKSELSKAPELALGVLEIVVLPCAWD